MTIISHLAYDVNDLIDQRQHAEDEWEDKPYIPAQFHRLVEGGMPPEEAADVVDFLADDGLPICEDPPPVADDDSLVVIWPGMYAEAA